MPPKPFASLKPKSKSAFFKVGILWATVFAISLIPSSPI